jgi:hypothetical protein
MTNLERYIYALVIVSSLVALTLVAMSQSFEMQTGVVYQGF